MDSTATPHSSRPQGETRHLEEALRLLFTRRKKTCPQAKRDPELQQALSRRLDSLARDYLKCRATLAKALDERAMVRPDLKRLLEATQGLRLAIRSLHPLTLLHLEQGDDPDSMWIRADGWGLHEAFRPLGRMRPCSRRIHMVSSLPGVESEGLPDTWESRLEALTQLCERSLVGRRRIGTIADTAFSELTARTHLLKGCRDILRSVGGTAGLTKGGPLVKLASSVWLYAMAPGMKAGSFDRELRRLSEDDRQAEIAQQLRKALAGVTCRVSLPVGAGSKDVPNKGQPAPEIGETMSPVANPRTPQFETSGLVRPWEEELCLH